MNALIADPSFRAIRVWQRNRDAFTRQWATELSGIIVEPVLILTVVGYGLGTYVDIVGDLSYTEFVAPGIIASYAMFHAAFECTYGAYLRMQTHKIYDSIIVTPLSVGDVTLGEIIWGASRSVLTASAVLTVAAAFGLVASPLAILVLPAAFLIGLMFASIAMTMTAVAPSIGFLNNYFTVFAAPMFFFCGTFFPLDELPDAVHASPGPCPSPPRPTLCGAWCREICAWPCWGTSRCWRPWPRPSSSPHYFSCEGV